jgi:hypothetical protein
VVPLVLRKKVLHLCHSAPTAGYSEVRRTCDRLFHSFFWPNWKRDVATFVRDCTLCQQLRLPSQPPRFVRATPKPVVACDFNEIVSMDIQGPFVRTTLGNVYVLNATCLCTHFTVSVALADTTAQTVATAFLSS